MATAVAASSADLRLRVNGVSDNRNPGGYDSRLRIGLGVEGDILGAARAGRCVVTKATDDTGAVLAQEPPVRIWVATPKAVVKGPFLLKDLPLP